MQKPPLSMHVVEYYVACTVMEHYAFGKEYATKKHHHFQNCVTSVVSIAELENTLQHIVNNFPSNL